jgi:ParB family transcriptional regulator, chromosome partitioning protein
MKIPISQIRPNPFQARQHVDRERVQALANEIKELGYWGSLRARKQGNYYELCFGHRRLEALKLLKIREVDLEVLKLSDDEMATQALVENIQREGLTDDEKGEGIHQLIERYEAIGYSDARQHVAALMGLGESRIKQLLSIRKLSPASKQLVATRQLSGPTALKAKEIGGDAMIATAVKHALPDLTLRKIQSELASIPEPKIREKVTKAIVAGKVRDPESVRTRVRQLRAAETGPAPSDLRLHVRRWTKTMQDWTKQLDQASDYIDYIEGDPEGAAKFKTAIRELIDKLKRFL